MDDNLVEREDDEELSDDDMVEDDDGHQRKGHSTQLRTGYHPCYT